MAKRDLQDRLVAFTAVSTELTNTALPKRITSALSVNTAHMQSGAVLLIDFSVPIDSADEIQLVWQISDDEATWTDAPTDGTLPVAALSVPATGEQLVFGLGGVEAPFIRPSYQVTTLTPASVDLAETVVLKKDFTSE